MFALVDVLAKHLPFVNVLQALCRLNPAQIVEDVFYSGESSQGKMQPEAFILTSCEKMAL